MQAKFNRFARSKYISPTFPPFAHTSTKTVASIENIAFVLSNGFKEVGKLSPDSYKDPLGNVTIATLSGSTSASTLEAVGHDALELVYGSYRIPTSTVVISISQTPRGFEQKFQTVDTDALTTLVDQGQDSDGIPIGSSTGKWLIAIPSTVEGVQPASGWTEAMHHPFAFKKWIPPAPFMKQGTKVSLKLRLNHRAFIKMFHRHPATDQGQEDNWINMSGNPGTGHQITWHLYICSMSSQSDAQHNFNIMYKIYQQVELSKFTASDTSIATQVGDDHIPTEA